MLVIGIKHNNNKHDYIALSISAFNFFLSSFVGTLIINLQRFTGNTVSFKNTNILAEIIKKSQQASILTLKSNRVVSEQTSNQLLMQE